MRRILTLTDFSTIAEKAVATAFGLAKRHGAHLTILHALDSGDYTTVPMAGSSLGSDHTSQKAWQTQAEALGVEVSYVVGAGYLPDLVAEVSAEINADLIVLGTTGRGDKNDKYWGSNAENITKESQVPVLAIKDVPPSPEPRNLVFASSFDVSELSTLQRSLRLLDPAENAVVHLLSIDTLKAFAQPAQVIKSVMRDFAKAIAPYSTELHFYADMNIDSGIKKFAQEVSPDVIIMAHRHHKSIKHFLRGNDTIRTVNKVPFPVLVVPV